LASPKKLLEELKQVRKEIDNQDRNLSFIYTNIPDPVLGRGGTDIFSDFRVFSSLFHPSASTTPPSPPSLLPPSPLFSLPTFPSFISFRSSPFRISGNFLKK
jgi:hypothetical protein